MLERRLVMALTRVVTLLIGIRLGAEGAKSTLIARLLPPEAKIIETADLQIGARANRALVLWMLRPARVQRHMDSLTCLDWAYGDHWYGPSRLSLIDSANHRVLNTLEVRGKYEGSTDPEHGFSIPFLLPVGTYYIPKVDKNSEGKPLILNLQDLTGEGVVGQFVLFEYEVCDTLLTTVVGYSRTSDRAVQYRVMRPTLTGKLEAATWTEKVFGTKPARPGYWDFTWEPGHGANYSIHEVVSFDATEQVFVQRQLIDK